jgi:hypothetical protein
MKKFLLPLLLIVIAAGARAEAAKGYQVTGPVVALTDSVITVMKGDEKWEIARGSAKVEGALAVGSRVTIYYRMVADSIEVKKAPAVDAGSKEAAKSTSRADAAAERASTQATKKKNNTNVP